MSDRLQFGTFSVYIDDAFYDRFRFVFYDDLLDLLSPFCEAYPNCKIDIRYEGY